MPPDADATHASAATLGDLEALREELYDALDAHVEASTAVAAQLGENEITTLKLSQTVGGLTTKVEGPPLDSSLLHRMSQAENQTRVNADRHREAALRQGEESAGSGLMKRGGELADKVTSFTGPGLVKFCVVAIMVILGLLAWNWNGDARGVIQIGGKDVTNERVYDQDLYRPEMYRPEVRADDYGGVGEPLHPRRGETYHGPRDSPYRDDFPEGPLMPPHSR